MDDKTKKILLILGASILLGTFIFMKFFKEDSGEVNFDSMGNYDIDDKKDPSVTDIIREKKKEEIRRINEERKVSSLESFLSDQVKKTPFEDSTSNIDTTSIRRFTPEQNQQQATVVPAAQTQKPKVIIKYVEKKSTAPVESEPVEPVESEPVKSTSRRKSGFAKTSTPSGSGTTNSGASGTGEINIPVVVEENTRVKSGNNIQLRTLEQTTINGKVIPANTIINGKVSLGSDKMNISVQSFKAGNNFINQKLIAYSADGSPGIVVEGGVVQEVRGDAVDDALNTVKQTVKIPILKDLPLNATKKIAKDPEIPIRKGHKLFLRTE